MILTTGRTEVTTGGVESSTSFGFDPKNLKILKKILRDTIYSDKILAVIREYGANAWDAHRMHGKRDVPIKVRVPTWDDPRLLIEDYGPGLSHEDMFNVYAMYVTSLKRESNDGVGMLGIGSKCGFCYSDTFIITSRHGGEKRVYVAKLNQDGDDSLDLLSTTPWTENTGITIEMAVRREDIKSFEEKARDLFKYFNPRPDINIELPPVPKIRNKLQHGLIFESGQYGNSDTRSGRWLALMGCIPYVVDLNQLRDSEGRPTISHIFRSCAGILDFEVGAVQISSSRESLEYSKETKETLAKKFEELFDEYTKFVLDEVEQGSSSDWEKRLKSVRLLHLGLSEEEIGDMAKTSVYPKTHTFKFSQSIKVLSDTRLIREIIPEGKDLRGYHLYDSTNILVKPEYRKEFHEPTKTWNYVQPTQYYTWEEIDAELQEVLKVNKLEGIPFEELDSLPWTPPYVPQKKRRPARVSGPKDEKHVKHTFRLTATQSYEGKKYSDNWDVVDHVPKASDVYVIIQEFVPVEYGVHFFKQWEKDQRLASGFGVQLPDIYGYKSTKTKPLDESKVVGTPYHVWRARWRESLVKDEDLKYVLDFLAWRDYPRPRMRTKPGYEELVMRNLARELGEDHPVVGFLKNVQWARNTFTDDLPDWQAKVSALGSTGLLPQTHREPDAIMEKFYEKYPLLRGKDISVLWGKMTALHWRQYIRCIDLAEKSLTPPK